MNGGARPCAGERDGGKLLDLALECALEVPRLAARLGVSQRSLRRFFKSRYGCCPRAWLREQRLQRARQMLGGAGTVKQVAYALHFPSPAQFCRDFKRRFGHSPSAALGQRGSRRCRTWSTGAGVIEG